MHPAGTILSTDSIERFVRIGTRFLERLIDPEEVELIDLPIRGRQSRACRNPTES